MLKFLQRLIAAQQYAANPRPKKTLKAKADISKNKVNVAKDSNRNKDKTKGKDSDKKKTKSKKDSKGKKEKKNKEHKKEKKKKKKRDLDSVRETALLGTSDPNDLDPQVFEVCKEKMRPVKKALKALDKPDISLSKSEQKSHHLQHLKTIGMRIDECLQEYSFDPVKSKEWRNHLWTFVSKFTEYHAKKLYKLYKHSIKSSDHKDSESGHPIKRDRTERHHSKQASMHSSFNPLKRESSSAFLPNNKIMKKERDDYNLFDPKPNQAYGAGSGASHSQTFRNSWPKHDNRNANRNMPYEREGRPDGRDLRPDHYSKPMYSRDETDRKYRHTSDRRFYIAPQNSSQHSSHFPIHGQSSSHLSHANHTMPVRGQDHYDQHYFAHTTAPVGPQGSIGSTPGLNNSSLQSKSYQSWSQFNTREPAYHRKDSYRRPFSQNADEKPPMNH